MNEIWFSPVDNYRSFNGKKVEFTRRALGLHVGMGTFVVRVLKNHMAVGVDHTFVQPDGKAKTDIQWLSPSQLDTVQIPTDSKPYYSLVLADTQ